MLEYNRETIDTLYSINKANVLTGIILDIKKGLEISPEGRALVLNKITELKALNDWDYETEERLLQMYKRQVNTKVHLEALSPKDKAFYNRERLKKLKEYNFSI